MTLNELREVSSISKVFIYNETKKEAEESTEYSTFLCKYGDCKVIRVYAELETSTISRIAISVKPINFVCEILIGAGRAIPFTILMVLVLPLTRWLIGTGVGTTATIVPLTIAAIPFVARTIANSLDLVENDIVEAAKIDGASNFKIAMRIKLHSRLFEIISSMGLTSVAIISYTAISGMLGGGGLGNYAIIKGYYQYNWLCVLWATLIIIGIVCLFQWGFKLLSKLVDWRKK